MLYFGCYAFGDPRDGGHFWYGPHRSSSNGEDRVFLRDARLQHVDVKYAPMTEMFVNYDPNYARKPIEETQPQSAVAMHYVNGWTAAGFWDRTGDDRGGSHGVFVERGRWLFKVMMEIAKRDHPKLVKRIEERPPTPNRVESAQGKGKPFYLWGSDTPTEGT